MQGNSRFVLLKDPPNGSKFIAQVPKSETDLLHNQPNKSFTARAYSRISNNVDPNCSVKTYLRDTKMECSSSNFDPESHGDFEYDGDFGERDSYDYGFGSEAGDLRKGRGRSNVPNADRDGSKSLRFFSHRVCDKVKEKRQTTYNEVAEELVQEYFDSMPPQSVEKQQHDVKNIRRRVYDALNVLIALNIVTKEKKTIHWVGPVTETDETDDEMGDDDEEAVARKEIRIRELLGELVGFKSLVEKNRNEEQKIGRPHEDTITYMPFVVIGTDKNTYVNCSISHDKSELLCDFNEEYQITEDQTILERLGHTYGVQTGVVEASNVMRVRSLVPKGLRHYLPSLPEAAQPVNTGVQQGELQPYYAGFDY